VPPCALGDAAAAGAHVVRIRLPGAAADVAFTVAELRERFPARTVVVTTQCGGNRRAHMNASGGADGGGGATAGIAWGAGAISTAAWTGAALCDVLEAAGLNLSADSGSDSGPESKELHVVFEGADGMQASVPASRALCRSSDVLLAYDMNGSPLPAHHGAPLRAVAPGVVGVRSVKWLSRVALQPDEASGPWQRGMAYKAFPPGVRSLEGVSVESLPSIQAQPVTSAIAVPADNDAVPVDAGAVVARGYAYAGGGAAIRRVDVSADGGRTWQTAGLDPDGSAQREGRAWAWTLWEAALPLPEGTKAGDELAIVARAVDEAGNVQPERVGPIWNLRGLNCNAWHTVRVRVVEAEAEEAEEAASE
jgi:sulfite oxidase